MSYGIETFNSNGNLQFSTSQETISVITSGTVANNGTVDFDNSKEIFMVNRTTTGWCKGDVTVGGGAGGIERFTNLTGATINYLKATRTSQVAENSAGTYGIRVFDTDGTTRLYSSNYSQGQSLIDILSPNTVGSFGDPTSPPTNLALIYSGTGPGDVWVSMTNSRYGASLQGGYYKELPYYDISNNKIYMANTYQQFVYPNSYYWLGSSNSSSVFLLKRKG